MVALDFYHEPGCIIGFHVLIQTLHIFLNLLHSRLMALPYLFDFVHLRILLYVHLLPQSPRLRRRSRLPRSLLRRQISLLQLVLLLIDIFN